MKFVSDIIGPKDRLNTSDGGGGGGTSSGGGRASRGGGSCGTAGVECHNHGARLEGGLPQSDASYEYGGLFQIPNANDELILEFQGLAHSDRNDRSGYEVAFSEGKPGVFLWKQETTYPRIDSGGSNYQVKAGSKVNIRIRKQDIGPASAPIGLEINAFADGQHVGRWRDMINSPLAGRPPYTGVKKDYRVGYRNDGLLGCNNKGCCHKGDPHTQCSMWIVIL